jgi:hypothetical protein
VDPSPTLQQFEGYVADKRVHWYRSGATRRVSVAAAIDKWVTTHFPAQRIGGIAAYDLSKPPSSQAVPPPPQTMIHAVSVIENAR